MQEQRLTRRVLKYWDMVRKTAKIPEMQRFNTTAIEDVWPYCLQISVDKHGRIPIYRYDYMGKPIIDMYGRDLTGLIVDQSTRQFPGKVIHHKFDDVLRLKEPMADDGHFMSEDGKLIKYRACILPLGTSKRGVTHIVVGLSCRYF